MFHLVRALLLVLLPVAAFAQDAVLPTPATVTAEGVPPVPLSLADAVSRYGEFRSATLLAWHPVERRILVSTVFGNVPQIHEVAGPGAARTQLTFFRDGVTGGAWYEPGGRYFVFLKDAGGGAEAMQLVRLDPATGATTLLTDGRSRSGEPVWSRHKGLIAFDSTRRDGKNRDIWVLNPDRPGTERMVAELEGSWTALDWSPDDRELLAFETVSSGFGYLWRIDVESGRRIALTDRHGPAVRVPNLDLRGSNIARYSADGRRVLALTDNGEELVRLWTRPVAADGRWTALTSAGEAVEAFAQSSDGRHLAVVYDREASSALEVITASAAARRVDLPPGVISRLAWRPGHPELSFVLSGAHTFSDVYSWHAARGTVERWTTSEVGGANPASLPDAEIVRWPSFDGRSISGVLYRPPARFTGPRPVIINIHGGPQERERPRFLGRSNYFRNELGIAIIYPNVRGSTGFGRTFEQLDDGRRRADVVKDIGALLDWIAGQPWLDKDRVMVTGGSYGGYLTLAAAIEYGDRIRCAFEGFGMSDLVSFLESTEESRRADRRLEYGDPADPEMRAFLKSISPLSHAARIRIPLFIAQGAKDTRVPLDQAEQMAAAIRANGTPLWYVVYTDAGHGLTRSTNDYNTYAWVLFVQRHLLDR
ncbi:MAG TPA: prolyl oligopeptidase family serine peptidase [Vicinamibacterales bacterium]|nr:prolyl oligopeptidase family serine peptidase [Vicinamibacterales bacterium]